MGDALGYFLSRWDLAHYHRRSNVKTTFSMIKRKFGDALRRKAQTALVNETLCEVLCHNLVVLIREMNEVEIDPVVWAGMPVAQQLGGLVVQSRSGHPLFRSLRQVRPRTDREKTP